MHYRRRQGGTRQSLINQIASRVNTNYVCPFTLHISTDHVTFSLPPLYSRVLTGPSLAVQRPPPALAKETIFLSSTRSSHYLSPWQCGGHFGILSLVACSSFASANRHSFYTPSLSFHPPCIDPSHVHLFMSRPYASPSSPHPPWKFAMRALH